MTKSKYLLSALLIAVCLFITGELQPIIAGSNITNFASAGYEIGEIITKEKSSEEFDALKDVFTSAATENNVGIFVKEYEGISKLEEIEHIYCIGNASEHLKKALNGNYEYNSVLVGKINYNIRLFDEIKRFNRYQTVYFCGDNQSVVRAQKYIGKYIAMTGSENSKLQGNIYLYMELGTFTLVFIIIMLYGISDARVRKKEFILKVINGESRLFLFGKYFLADVIAYGTIFAAESFIIAKLNSLIYCKIHIIVFALCVFAGAFLCCLHFLMAAPSEVLKGREDKKKTLSSNWIVKVIVSALIICVISIFITVLMDSVTYIKTADFFEQHSDYSFCYMARDDDWETMVFDRENYADNNYTTACNYYDVCQPLLINREAYPTSSDRKGDNGYYIFSNANTIDYVKSVVKEFKNVEITADYVVIAPEKIINDSFIEKNLYVINNRYDVYISEDKELYNKNNIQIVETEKSYDIFATDNDKESEMGIYKDEPVIICTVPENQSAYLPKEMNLGSQNYYMFKIDDRLKSELISKNAYTSFVQTNCKEQYDYFWRMNKLALMYFGAFSIILIVLEIIVLSFVVKLKFDLNKEELCIKKVLGYTLLSRYGELIAATLLSSFVCSLISIFVLSRIDTNTPAIVVVVISLILLAFEFVIILFNAIRLEKANIQKILKGGAL